MFCRTDADFSVLLSMQIDSSFTASNPVRMQIRCRFNTVYLPFLQIICSSSTCGHPLSGDHWLDNFKNSFVPCRIFVDNMYMVCILHRTSLDNLVPNMHFVQFFISSHPCRPAFHADRTYFF